MEPSMASAVENYIKYRKKGEAITRAQIIDKTNGYGHENAVDKAISRIAHLNQLTRIKPGIYVRPKESRFGPIPPSLPSIIRSLEAKYCAVIVPAGAKAINNLGISTQLPMKYVFVSNKRISSFELGGRDVVFTYVKELPQNVSRDVASLYSAMIYLTEEDILGNYRTIIKAIEGLRPRSREQFLNLSWNGINVLINEISMKKRCNLDSPMCWKKITDELENAEFRSTFK